MNSAEGYENATGTANRILTEAIDAVLGPPGVAQAYATTKDVDDTLRYASHKGAEAADVMAHVVTPWASARAGRPAEPDPLLLPRLRRRQRAYRLARRLTLG